MRGFELVSNVEGGKIPERGSKASAGYDISIITGATIAPGEVKVFNTGVKAYMNDDEFLSLHVRSSVGIKMGLILANITGIIDSDYYNNESNEGHIMVALHNISNKEVVVEDGMRVCQGIFTKYLTVANDASDKTRVGGIGSTN
ncbi:dUTP diphosphatase [Mollicutes bacterium LVI A0078]|nr:dUTP diphosphatase [Mollicutes bacterium LVI A0075]WOO90665.1 dUTP diphosphatase [Mollicutes bacterium LVI A0078]